MKPVVKPRKDVIEALENDDNFDYEIGTWGNTGISIVGNISQWQTSKLRRAGYQFAFCQDNKLVFKRE